MVSATISAPLAHDSVYDCQVIQNEDQRAGDLMKRLPIRKYAILLEIKIRPIPCVHRPSGCSAHLPAL